MSFEVAEAIRNDGAQLVSFVIPLSSAQALLKKYGANGTSDRRCAGVANSRWGVVDKKNKCPDGYTIIDTSTIEGNGNGISIPDGAKICFVDVHVLNNKGYGFYVRAQGEMPPGKNLQNAET